jgi:hypothetical protein
MVKIGDTVRSTGRGKSISWGNFIGIVIKIVNEKYLVEWVDPQFCDWMSFDEIELIDNLKEKTFLKFSDGIVIHTNGPLKTIELIDGWYVAGGGETDSGGK